MARNAAQPEAGTVVPPPATHADDSAQLRREIAELKATVRARDEFISIVGHELRNPLSPVFLHLQMMRDVVQQRPQSIDAKWLEPRLDGFAARLDRFIAVLDRVLDVSRISTGRLQLDLEDVDLADVVADVVDTLDREATVAQSEVRVKLTPGFVGRWDRLRLEQICGNLLSNAIRYGLGRPIDVELRDRGATVELEVRDGGIGIAPDDLARIFQQFERGTGNRQRGGFGVGLWLVDRLCAAMGGHVRVQSRLGAGSTFTVTLPRQSR